MEQFLNILILSIADRTRGTTSIAVWLMAYIVSGYFDFNIWIILGFVLGESTGWGAPLGAILKRRVQGFDFEWWQNKWLSLHPELSNIIRGLWWGLCPYTLGCYSGVENAIILLPSIAIPYIVSPYIARNIRYKKLSSWRLMEYIRGGLIGLLLEVLI